MWLEKGFALGLLVSILYVQILNTTKNVITYIVHVHACGPLQLTKFCFTVQYLASEICPKGKEMLPHAFLSMWLRFKHFSFQVVYFYLQTFVAVMFWWMCEWWNNICSLYSKDEQLSATDIAAAGRQSQVIDCNSWPAQCQDSLWNIVAFHESVVWEVQYRWDHINSSW